MCRSYALIGTVLLLVTVGGCGGPAKPKLHPVKGKVTVGGQPLANCTVSFAPIGGKGLIGYSGKLNANGEYELSDTQDERKGAAVGKYKVTLKSPTDTAQKAMEEMGKQGGDSRAVTGPEAMQKMMGGGQLFPIEYAQADTSPKEVEVKAESNVIDIVIP
ncbi:MAG: hypothetical protein ACKV0T_11680 [Planctomycetales bacterium]